MTPNTPIFSSFSAASAAPQSDRESRTTNTDANALRDEKQNLPIKNTLLSRGLCPKDDDERREERTPSPGEGGCPHPLRMPLSFFKGSGA